MDETQPLRRVAREIENLAFKLKDKAPIEAAELKDISYDIFLSCDMQDQVDMTSSAKLDVRLDELFQKIQALNIPAMTTFINKVYKEQQKKPTDFHKLAVDSHDEDGASARQMTDKEWLLCYRNMNDATIQK
ncbi:hypothetical protein CEP54_005779 [Fusarium duplospermum]|uniref:Uncharacterized protein n=1 Tax=Fusarium duplospermum TaxID=1325734 RepID=A0A428QAN4_9HYPO|nr:hypothetical protein CEP54_005779 [Fusarium duplospermum]